MQIGVGKGEGSKLGLRSFRQEGEYSSMQKDFEGVATRPQVSSVTAIDAVNQMAWGRTCHSMEEALAAAEAFRRLGYQRVLIHPLPSVFDKRSVAR